MVQKKTLKNGVRLIYEHLPNLPSCALSVWAKNGSRHEPEEVSGISHFIEHMMFKGTKKRTPEQLAIDFDAIGGQVNAFTTKENTCYYCRTLGEYLPKAAELLCDMYFNSTFPQKEIELERSVIIEEIGMYEDTPEDLVNEILIAKVFGSALGRPILGYKETLAKMTGKTLLNYKKQNYVAENTVVALCGNFTEHDLDMLEQYFEGMKSGKVPVIDQTQYQSAVAVKKKDIEQNHLLLTFPGLELGSKDRFVAQVLNGALGGGMSSRLFQSVREKAGLCYTIYSFASSFECAGIFGIYTALSQETEKKAVVMIKTELEKVRQHGITKEELERNRAQIKANTLMSMESNVSRMMSLARNEFVYGRDVGIEEIAEKIDAVTKEDVLTLAQNMIDFKQVSFAAVGKVQNEEGYRSLL